MSQAHPETINESSFMDVSTAFRPTSNSTIQIGLCFILSPFRTSEEQTVQTLKNLLHAAEKTNVPVMIHLDLEQWWEARPDLWNWWNPDIEGFNPDNRKNVEWTGWSADDAIKIAWRNWGRQIRVLPPPNLSSPQYLKACSEQIRLLIPWVVKWADNLPEDKKHLFAGLKVGHESSIGVNAFYYPNGNDLLDKPISEDPQTGINSADVLSRGVQQIGYAAIQTAGIRTSGDVIENDIYEAVRRYLLFLSKETAACGVPREKLFTHGAGWSDGELLYDAAVNPYACPGWSFYAHAANPMNEPAVKRNLEKTDAPYWGAVEWMLMENVNPESQRTYSESSKRKNAWKSALRNTLSAPRAKLVCVYNWESIEKNEAAIAAVQELIDEHIPESVK